MDAAAFARAANGENPGTRDATASFDSPIWLIAGSV
jgi:hypothetical protein